MIRSIELKNFAQFKSHKIGDPTRGVGLEEGLINISGGNGSGKSNLFAGVLIALGARKVGGREYYQYIRYGEQKAKIIVEIDNTFNHFLGRRPLNIYDIDEIVIECTLTRDKREYHINGRPQKSISEYIGMLKMANIDLENELMFVEQNTVNSICEKRPQELLSALEVPLGIRDVRKRYDHAKQDYDTAEEEYKKLEFEVRRLKSEVDEIEANVRVYREYKEIIKEKEDLEKKLQVSEYYGLKENIQKNKNDLKRIEDEIQQLEKKMRNAEDEKRKHHIKFKDAENLYEKMKTKEEEKIMKIGDIKAKAERLSQQINDLKSKIEEIENLGPKPEGDLKEIEEVLNRKLREKELCLAGLENKLGMLEKEISLAESKKPSYPPIVKEFTDKLEGFGIEYLILSETITIINPEWQLAIESILGPNRFNIIIPTEGKMLQIKQIADRMKYPYYVQRPYIYTEKNSSRGKRYAIDVIEIHDERVSGWVHEFLGDVALVDSIEEGDSLSKKGIKSITKSGYYQDRIGGISKRIKEEELVCGEQARLMRLRALKARKSDVLAEKKRISNLVSETRIELTRASEWQQHPFLEIKLRKTETELCNEKERLKTEEKELSRIRKDREKARKNAEVASRTLSKVETQLEFYEEKLKTTQTRKDEISKIVDENEKRLEDLSSEVQGLIQLYPKESLGASSEYQGQIKGLAIKLRLYPKDLNPEIEKIYETKMNEYNKQLDEFNERKQNREEWTARYGKEKELFNLHVKRQIEIVNRRFKEILRRIDAEGSIELRDTEKGTELWIYSQFKDKKRAPMHDKMHSGGERTAIALALLLALQKANPSPFYMLDEFDMHLDEVRGQEYMELFGQEPGIQYFIISPRKLSVSSVVQSIYLINEKGSTKAIIMVPGKVARGQTSLERIRGDHDV